MKTRDMEIKHYLAEKFDSSGVGIRKFYSGTQYLYREIHFLVYYLEKIVTVSIDTKQEKIIIFCEESMEALYPYSKKSFSFSKERVDAALEFIFRFLVDRISIENNMDLEYHTGDLFIPLKIRLEQQKQYFLKLQGVIKPNLI